MFAVLNRILISFTKEPFHLNRLNCHSRGNITSWTGRGEGGNVYGHPW